LLIGHLQIAGLLVSQHPLEVGDGLHIIRRTHGGVRRVLRFFGGQTFAAINPFELVQCSAIIACLTEEVGYLHLITGLQFAFVPSLLHALQRFARLPHRGIQRCLFAQRETAHRQRLGKVLLGPALVSKAHAHLPALGQQSPVVAFQRQRFGGRRTRRCILLLRDQGTDQQTPVGDFLRIAADHIAGVTDRSIVVAAGQRGVPGGGDIDRLLLMNRIQPTAQLRGFTQHTDGLVGRQLRLIQMLRPLQRFDQHHPVVRVLRRLADRLACKVGSTVVVTIGVGPH
jgi:hypothetical protein